MTRCQGKQSVPQLSQRMLLILSMQKVVEWKSPVNVSRVNKRLLVWILYSLKWKHWSLSIEFHWVYPNIEGDTEPQGGPASEALNLICTAVLRCNVAAGQFGLEKDLWLNKNTHQTFALITQRKAPFPLALYHFHLIHVESQSSSREGYFPLYKKKNSLWFSWKQCLTEIK